MTLTEFTRRTDRLLRRYEYDDGVTIVADLSLPDEAVSVDLLDGTAIVVVEADGTTDQHEVELPEGDAEAFMKNGVLTIDVRQ